MTAGKLIRVVKFFVAIFGVVAMLGVSAASESAAHVRERDHCDICCTAHLAVRQTAAVVVVHTLSVLTFLALAPATVRAESSAPLTLLTRGPPAR